VLSKTPFECPPYLLSKCEAIESARIAVVNAGSPVVMESIKLAVDHDIAETVLIGDTAEIRKFAKELEWDLSDKEIVNAADETEAAWHGAQLAQRGEATAVMKGHVHTDVFMRALIDKEAGLRTERRFTHVFHMTIPGSEKTLLISDAAVNVAPDFKTKTEILLNAVDVANALGSPEPKVGLLAASEEVSSAMPVTEEWAELVKWANNQKIPAQVFGPLAFDNIISPDAARTKGIDHPVAGNADIVIVPTIETGNALFKAMVYLCSACAAGLVLGAKVPIMLTSRADPPEARLASAALAAIVANYKMSH